MTVTQNRLLLWKYVSSPPAFPIAAARPRECRAGHLCSGGRQGWGRGHGKHSSLLSPTSPEGEESVGLKLKTSLHRLWPGGLVITLQGRPLSERHFLGLKIMVGIDGALCS